MSSTRLWAASPMPFWPPGTRPCVRGSRRSSYRDGRLMDAVLNRPVSPPACLLSGGETTVTLRGGGLGGRNMELALAAGIELSGCTRTVLLSAGTDGTDGPTDAAGGFADGSTVSRAEAFGISAAESLAGNDSYRFFERLGDLLITGPTYTNVMDLQITLVK